MLWRQFRRYLITGVLGTGTHLIILVFCVEYIGLSSTPGSAAGFMGALSVSYLLNHHWAFDSSRPHRSSLWRYVLVSSSGLLLNTSMVSALVHYLQWWYMTAQLSVIWIVPLINFILNRHWTFNAYSKVQKQHHVSE